MLLIILYVGGLGATSTPNLLGGKPTPNLKAHAQMVTGIKTSIHELLTVYGKNKNSHICQFSLWNQRLYIQNERLFQTLLPIVKKLLTYFCT